MQTMTLVDVSSISLVWPTKTLFVDLSFTVDVKDRVGVLGINGSGKSTLLNVLAGTETADQGVIRRRADLAISFLSQRPELGEGTVSDAVGSDWQAKAAIDRLGLTEIANRNIASLSGGQQKRAALAAVLENSEAGLLILDEPTNHLDIEGIEYLERVIKDFAGGVVFVSHDRYLIDRVATKTIELSSDGAFVVEGGYQSHLLAKAERQAKSDRDEATRRVLERKELAWLQRGARARRRKSKSRLAIAQRTLTAPAREEQRIGPLALNDFGQQRLGRQVIDLENVGAEVGGKKLFDNVKHLMSSMERLGVVGPNGVGKSTLLDVIAGRRIPTTGTVNYGSTIRIGYFDQTGQTLDQDASVEEIVAGPGSRLDHRQTNLLGRFWFEPATHRAQVKTLSGGEQRRLQLMSVLASEPNVLLLDEPTNDLDLDTLRALEEWLDTFRGALVVVTHDRALLERTVEHVVALSEEGFRHLGAGDAVWEQVRSKSQPNNPRSKAKTKERQRSGRSLSTLRYELKEAEVEMEKLALERDQCRASLADDSITHSSQQEMYRSLASTLESLENTENQWLAISEEIEGRT